MPIETLNPDVWKLAGTLSGTWTETGGPNFGWGTIATENQKLTAAALLSVYKLLQGDQSLKKDYFLVVGDVYHGIQGSPSNPGSNWVSVGFYANYFDLKITTTSPETRVTTFGPNSTMEQATISFSIGGELGGEAGTDGGKGSGSLSANVGVSFSASEVSFAARPSLSSIEWYTSLPGVGWISSAVPPNPAEPSYAGYLWNPAVIFEVPQGKSPQLAGQLTIDFEFNWTRGIRKRSFTPIIDLVFSANEDFVTTDEPAKPLSTIMQTLYHLSATGGKNGSTDTFLAALQLAGAAQNLDDSNLQQFVIAPTNAAIETYFDQNPDVALKAVSPANKLWLETWIAERVISLPPKPAWKTSLADLKSAVKTGGKLIECSDGLLFLSDNYEVSPQLLTALKSMVAAARP